MRVEIIGCGLKLCSFRLSKNDFFMRHNLDQRQIQRRGQLIYILHYICRLFETSRAGQFSCILGPAWQWFKFNAQIFSNVFNHLIRVSLLRIIFVRFHLSQTQTHTNSFSDTLTHTAFSVLDVTAVCCMLYAHYAEHMPFEKKIFSTGSSLVDFHVCECKWWISVVVCSNDSTTFASVTITSQKLFLLVNLYVRLGFVGKSLMCVSNSHTCIRALRWSNSVSL